MPRIKKDVTPAITTIDQATTLVREIVEIEVQRRHLRNERDGRKLQIDEAYESKLAPLDAESKLKLGQAQEFFDSRPELFAKRKSIEFDTATVGYRTATPSLKTLRGWTWKKVLDAFLAHGFFKAFVRQINEVDKEAVLARRDQLHSHDLALVGVRVEQTETFYVDPKLERFETKLKEAA